MSSYHRAEPGARGLPDLVRDIDNLTLDQTLNKVLPKDNSAPALSSATIVAGESSHSEVSPNKDSSRKDSVTSHVQDPNMSNADPKGTPRRLSNNRSSGRGSTKLRSMSQSTGRPCQQHSFLTDITDVRQMEQGLLQLLDDFHSGKLQAFGKDCTFEKMEHVREQQERLARLHFDLNSQQEIYGPQSEDGRRIAKENLAKLIENLQQLSLSIEQLQSSNSSVQTDV